MIGLIEIASGDLVAIVDSTAGYDMTRYTTVTVTGDPTAWRWDKATQQLVPRPLSAGEVTQADLEADPRWQAMRTATPAQVETWLAANVTDLASARRVLKLLVMAVQIVARTRT